MTNDLPPGWAWATVAAVADVQLGRQRSPRHHAGEQMRPYLRAANVTWQGICVDDVKTMNFDDVDFAKYKLEPGDILLNEASGSPHEVGKPAIWRSEVEDCCFQNTLLRLRPQLVDRNYVYWYCYASALTGRLGEAGRGVNIRHLGKRGLAQFRIPVAPLAEQGRVVDAIEEHFSSLDAAESALRLALYRVEAFRSSLLADAFYANARPPSDWKLDTIGDVAAVQLGRQRSPQHHTGSQMRPYLRSANVTWQGISLSDVKQMNFNEADFATFKLEPGDLLLNEASGSPSEVGKPAIWNGEIENCCFQNTLLRLRPHEIDVGYLYWYCYAAARSGRFGDAGRGVNIRHLGKQGLARFPVLIAPIEQRGQIVGRLENEFQQAATLEQAARSALDRVAALRRSILAAAFTGQLVPQDPSAEPASVLLERIETARSSEEKPRRASA